MQIDTSVFKEKLLAEKARLEGVLSGMGKTVEVVEGEKDWVATPPERDESDMDPTSIANRVEDFEANVAGVTTIEQQLRDVVDALQKIENGTYGVCEVSGQPIEIERLEANPAARTCIMHMGK